MNYSKNNYTLPSEKFVAEVLKKYGYNFPSKLGVRPRIIQIYSRNNAIMLEDSKQFAHGNLYAITI